MNITQKEIPKRFIVSKDKVANLIIIDVLINGILVPCVFDTGASISVLKADIAAKVNAVITQDTVVGGGNAGQVMSASMATIRSVEFGNTIIQEHRVAVAPNEAFDFGLDSDGKEIHVSGFFGWDIIQHFKWHYSADDNSFLVDLPVNNSNAASMGEWDNMPIIYADCFGENRLFGLDTGHTESVLGNVLYPLFEGSQEEKDMFVGIGGIVEEIVRSVQCLPLMIQNREIKLHNISAINRAVFPSDNDCVCGLLGMDILYNKNWILDYHNRRFEILS